MGSTSCGGGRLIPLVVVIEDWTPALAVPSSIGDIDFDGAAESKMGTAGVCESSDSGEASIVVLGLCVHKRNLETWGESTGVRGPGLLDCETEEIDFELGLFLGWAHPVVLVLEPTRGWKSSFAALVTWVVTWSTKHSENQVKGHYLWCSRAQTSAREISLGGLAPCTSRGHLCHS